MLFQAEQPGWVNTASLMLLGELRRRAPEAIDWAGMPDVVPVLDAFEAAQDTRVGIDDCAGASRCSHGCAARLA